MTEQPHPDPDQHASAKSRRGWREVWTRLLSIPGIVFTAAIAALTTWAVTGGISRLERAGGAPVRGQGPVAVVVETNPGVVSGLEYDLMSAVIPNRKPPSGNAGPGCSGFVPWVRQHGGVDAGHTLVRVIVQGLTATPVLISGLSVTKQLVTSPIHGTEVMCAGTQGEAEIRAISVDLDKTPARVLYDLGRRTFGFTVGQGETEVFDIDASTNRSRIRWTMVLELIVEGHHEDLSLTDNGRPFETTALGSSNSMWSWLDPEWHAPLGAAQARSR